MTACSDVSAYQWLTGDEARAQLDELAADRAALHAAVARLRERFSAEQTHLLLEQVELRRRASAKFAQSHGMFFTRTGLEQATDEWVAAYKASRFKQRHGGASIAAVADLCCGIGGDLIALTREEPTLGIDSHPVAAHFAAVNSGARVEAMNVVEYDVASAIAWHIDPDRRDNRRRTSSLEACEPNLSTIERLLTRNPHAALKLAPATHVPLAWAERCELEWISRDGECRQLVAWHGELAQKPGQRLATILARQGDSTPHTVVGVPDQRVPIVRSPERFVFDVDAAVLAARLKGALAADYSLSALSSGATYLTGPRPVGNAALACFEVAEVMPLQTRKLAHYLRERAVGKLEIKKRGVDLTPEQLRRELKLRGDDAATLLICRVGGRPTAIVARRIV
jgi:hypothetical protein